MEFLCWLQVLGTCYDFNEKSREYFRITETQQKKYQSFIAYIFILNRNKLGKLAIVALELIGKEMVHRNITGWSPS